MTLSLAYSNSALEGKPDKDSHPDHHPHMQWISGHIRLGTRVLVDRTFGQVVGYNIAGFGMWLGSLYPLLVRLEDGTVMRCKLCEVMPLPSVEKTAH